MSASILMTLLDDILSKGYGIISAISLFIAVNVAEELFWACLSPLKESNEFEGVFIALFDFLINYLLWKKPSTETPIITWTTF